MHGRDYTYHKHHTHGMSVVDQVSHAQAMNSADEHQIPVSLLDLLSSSGNDSLDLESPAAKAYLDRLVSLGLDDLIQEPSIISNERSGVDLELVNLCYREYSTFTSVHQCSAAIGSAFDDFDSSLDKLIESIPALEDECRQFGQGTSEIQRARKRAVLLQEHEDKLLDVLEIPQLMETCVRNGYYQEALELSSHVTSLREKHHAIIVDDVADEANGILQLMTAQLLGVLREPVKLPALIKAVGYLRKLQDLDDIQLGLAFLSSRLHNYRARLIEIEKDRAEPVRYLRRYIDLFREHVFDIISQYTTIFSGVAGNQLATFVNLCVDDLVQLVHKYIPRIASDSAAMSSILVQLGYCSLSFARAGLDFSSLLIEPFHTSIKLSYDQATESAAALIKTTLALEPQPPTPSSLVSGHHLPQILADPHSPPINRRDFDAHTPPAVLAHFPPIAQYLNAHLTALNSLRLLAPFQSLPALQASQNTSIQAATSAVLDYVEQAVAIEMSGELSRSSGSRHRHTRTNSTPRSHLIRRNTETQWSAETLAAKRRETRRICVAFADAWVMACDFLRQALAIVLETDVLSRETEEEALKHLQEWIEANREKDLDQEPAGAHKVNGDKQMNSLEEGSEVLEGQDESTKPSETVPQNDTVPIASPVAESAELAPPIPSIPTLDNQPPPTLAQSSPVDSIGAPLAEEAEATPVEEAVPVFDAQTVPVSSEGIDLPPIPPQIYSEPVAPETVPKSRPVLEAIGSPPKVETQAEAAEISTPAESGVAVLVEENMSADDPIVSAIEEPTPETQVEPTVKPKDPVELDTPSLNELAIEPVVSEQPAAAHVESPNPTADSSAAAQGPATDAPTVELEPEPAVNPVEDVPITGTPGEATPIESPTDATPADEEEGPEPGTGTVTPTAEANGQEAGASKANKKKKKKKGKK